MTQPQLYSKKVGVIKPKMANSLRAIDWTNNSRYPKEI